MIQRACVYVSDKKELLKLSQSDSNFLEIAARFRPCFLIAAENEAVLPALNYHSVINIHNSWPSSLTHKNSGDNHLFVESEITQTWVMNVDCWFLLPAEHRKKLVFLSPHLYFFDSTAGIKTI